MRALSTIEVEEVAGGGWIIFIVAIAGGFIVGGPAGAGAMVATMLAGAGAKNLEHIQKHGEIPTFDQVIN